MMNEILTLNKAILGQSTNPEKTILPLEFHNLELYVIILFNNLVGWTHFSQISAPLSPPISLNIVNTKLLAGREKKTQMILA